MLNHSCAHLLAQAIRHLYPHAKFWVGPVVAEGFYYDVDLGDDVIRDEDVAAIEKEMKKLAKKGIPEDKISYYIENVNYLGNLQLLEVTPNEEKNNKDFDEWLKEAFPNPDQLKVY